MCDEKDLLGRIDKTLTTATELAYKEGWVEGFGSALTEKPVSDFEKSWNESATKKMAEQLLGG